METQLPQVHIDTQQAWADLGLKPAGQQAREQAALAREHTLQAISQTARDGDRLASVEVPGNTIPDLARERTTQHAELNVGVAPTHKVQVQLDPGQVNVRLMPGQARLAIVPPPSAGRRINVLA